MSVVESSIEVINTGKYLDTTQVAQTDGTLVQREVVVVGDPETTAAYAKVSNLPIGGTDYGLATRTITGAPSVSNNTTALLGAGATWTGTGEDVSAYGSVVVATKSDLAGTLYMEFSPDGTNWDSSLSFTVAAAVNEVHRLSVTRRYYRARYTNTAGTQAYFRLQSLFGAQAPLTSALNSTVQTDADSLVTRSVLMGQTDGGSFGFVPITPEGHLEVAVHGPRLPFGSIHTESISPVFQTDGVYGINSGQALATTSLSGGTTTVDSEFQVSTGTTVGAQGVIQSRKRLRYRPGQGIIGRFTARYTAPVAYSYQLAGLGHSEDGVYFGYGDTNDLTSTAFGILYVNRGVREVRTLTVTTGATGAGNITVTLNTGSVTVVPVTGASNIQRTVWELSQATYAGWAAYPLGATVIFVRNAAGTASGTYTFGVAATGAVGTFGQTKAGVASTDLFIPQSTWNGDVMDGTGPSGSTLDLTKGNVFQIGVQYLGYGAITFDIEVAPTDGNNAEFVTVHTIKAPNTLTKTTFGNPAFPFTLAAYSAGSTTNITTACGSFAGFVEGEKSLQGNRFSYFNILTTVAATNLQALFTVLNMRTYAGRTNQAVIVVTDVAGALKHSSPTILYLIRQGTLAGNPSFTQYATNSCSAWDTAATTVTYATNDQLVWTGHLGDTGELDHSFMNALSELTLQPGEWITLAAKASTGTPAYVSGSLNTREDQ